MVCLHILDKEDSEDSKTLAIAISLVPHGSHVKDLYNKNCKTAEKEIEEDTRIEDGKTALYQEFTDIVKIVILSKAVLQMKHNLHQNFNGILYRTNKQTNKNEQNILIFL